MSQKQIFDLSDDSDFFEDNNNYTVCAPVLLKNDLVNNIENTLSDVSSEDMNIKEELREYEELLFNTKSHPSP